MPLAGKPERTSLVHLHVFHLVFTTASFPTLTLMGICNLWGLQANPEILALFDRPHCSVLPLKILFGYP